MAVFRISRFQTLQIFDHMVEQEIFNVNSSDPQLTASPPTLSCTLSYSVGYSEPFRYDPNL